LLSSFRLIQLLKNKAEPDLHALASSVEAAAHSHHFVLDVGNEKVESAGEGLEEVGIYREAFSFHLVVGVSGISVIEQVEGNLHVGRVEETFVCLV
jgi:hypothetical protein